MTSEMRMLQRPGWRLQPSAFHKGGRGSMGGSVNLSEVRKKNRKSDAF